MDVSYQPEVWGEWRIAECGILNDLQDAAYKIIDDGVTPEEWGNFPAIVYEDRVAEGLANTSWVTHPTKLQNTTELHVALWIPQEGYIHCFAFAPRSFQPSGPIFGSWERRLLHDHKIENPFVKPTIDLKNLLQIALSQQLVLGFTFLETYNGVKVFAEFAGELLHEKMSAEEAADLVEDASMESIALKIGGMEVTLYATNEFVIHNFPPQQDVPTLVAQCQNIAQAFLKGVTPLFQHNDH